MLPQITANSMLMSHTRQNQEIEPEKNMQFKFNDLPIEIVQIIASKLPLPDVLRLKQLCRYANHCIDSHTIKKAARRYSIKFKNIKKAEIKEIKHFFKMDMRTYQICRNGNLASEKNTIPEIKEISGVFAITHLSYYRHSPIRHESSGLNDTLSIHLGTLENGLFFMLAINPKLCSRFIKYSERHMIAYAGDTNPTSPPNENNHAMYCGKSYEEALKVFELACKGTVAAMRIRSALGVQKKYY